MNQFEDADEDSLEQQATEPPVVFVAPAVIGSTKKPQVANEPASVQPSVNVVPNSENGKVTLPTDPEELFLLGFAHFDSVDPNKRRRAAMLFDKAAEKNHPKALRFLAHCFYEGIGVTQSLAQAVEIWQRASDLGDQESQYKLAEMLLIGDELPQNFPKAFEMLTDLSEQGHIWAQYNLAEMYRNGQGTAKDEVKALEWYQKASDGGHEFAETELAMMLDDLPDFSVPQDAPPAPGAENVEWE